MTQNLNVCFSPALFPYYCDNPQNTLAIAVDVFRASSTICAMLAAGASAVYPVADIHDAEKAKQRSLLVGAERNADKCSFADFGNSPFDYTADKVKDAEIVFSTTNGTQVIKEASACKELIIGAFVNIGSVADFCCNANLNVLICCAGWNNRFNIEDSLFAGALCERLLQSGKFEFQSDAALTSLHLWEAAKADVWTYLQKSEHIERLMQRGLEKDVRFCLTMDAVNVLPKYNKATKKIVLA